MSEQVAGGIAEAVPPVYKSVTVGVSAALAWEIFTERPTDWWPSGHQVVPGQREAIVFEPWVGGRYYERHIDGAVAVWGLIRAWEPPHRLLMTWRVDGNWQSIPDDAKASEIEVTFIPHGASRTEVTLGHLNLHRHGDGAGPIRAALEGSSPGPTLANFARAAELRATALAAAPATEP
jgi:uncharacterized protein YndB with AHSA1/START domain